MHSLHLQLAPAAPREVFLEPAKWKNVRKLMVYAFGQSDMRVRREDDGN